MRLSEVSEPKKIAAFALGRMNPATIGHELLVNAIKAQPGDHFLFLTDRSPKLPDNPLTSEQKLDWARKSFNGIAVGLAKTVLTAADRLYKMGYTEVTFLEGENKLYNLLTQYNGVEKEMHNFNFDKINYVQLKRDPEAEDATGMSGTKLRNYVSNNDFEAFKKAITQAAQPYAEEMYKELQSALGVAPAESISEAPAQEPAPQNKTYTIVRGDNLTKIAKANNTTIQDIMKLNPKIKDPNLIYAGDSLVLPATPAAPAAPAAPAQTTEPTQAAPAQTTAGPDDGTRGAQQPAAPAQTTPPAQPQTSDQAAANAGQPQTPDPNAQKAKPEDPQTTTPVPTNQQKPVEEPPAEPAKPAEAPAIKNPYTGADAEKFASLSPEDQAWLTKGGGKPDINDEFILNRAPNKGQPVAKPAATNQQKPVEEPAAKTTTATDQQQPAAEKPAAQANVSKEPSPKPPSMIPSLDKKFKVNGKEMTGNEIAGRFNDLLDKLGLGESLHFTSRIGQYLLEALNNAELKELQSLLDAVKGDPFFADYLDPIADKLTANGLKWQAGSAPQTKSKKTKPKTSTTKYYKTDPETGEEVEVSKDEADAAEQNFRKSIGSSDDFEDEMDSKYDAIKKRAQGQGGQTTSSSSSSSTRSVTTTGGGSTTTSTTGGGGTTRFIAKYRDTDESKKLIAQAKAVRNEEMKAFVDDYDQKNPNADRFDAFKDPGYEALRKKEQDLKDQAKAAMEMVHPAGVMTPDGNIKYYGKGANKDGSWDGEQFSPKDKDQKESINLNRLKVLAGVS